MNHQAIIEQLSQLAPKLKAAESPEAVLVKYASDRNLSAAQLERIGQVYNIAKTLNFMDKSASRGDSFRVLDTQKMLADYTSFKPKPQKEAASTDEWNSWFDAPVQKAASAVNPDSLDSWIDAPEKVAKIVEEDGQYVVYSEDGSKRLSKPGTKAEAVKRLRQVEYFKKHKKANSVPNLLGMAKDEDYTDLSFETSELPKTAAEQIKQELREDAFLRYEIETTKQVMDDAAEEARKIAGELLELHRVSPLPFAVMEHDAYYCSEDEKGTKEATEFVAKYFGSKGWNLERHDFSNGMPKLARDRHNALPLFNSILEKLELYKSASLYLEDLEKKSSQVEQRRRSTTEAEQETGEFPREQSGRRAPEEMDTKELFRLLSAVGPQKSSPGGDTQKGISDKGINEAVEIAKGVKSIYDPATYLNKQTQDFVGNILKAPALSSTNKRQKNLDVAVSDVARVADLQRLMLSDPIIGEADPDTVVSLYNTLANANPEIVRDKNLLRFALREALQYDAVPLHTYKDLISMGKDRADMEERMQKAEERKYSI